MSAITGKQLNVYDCPLCKSFKSKRLTSLEQHVNQKHNTTLQNVWNSNHNGPTYCQCGCNQPTTWLGWNKGYSKLIKGHNGSIYKIYDKATADNIANKRGSKLKGQTNWAKGLTKETSDKIKKRGIATSIGRKKLFDSGKLKIWNVGLTKDSDFRLLKFSESQKDKFKLGILSSWSKGLTKHNNKSLAMLSAKLSILHKQRHIREYLDSIKRLPQNEIKNRIESTGRLTLIDSKDYINHSVKNILVECNDCKKQFINSLKVLSNGKCVYCDFEGSKEQLEIKNFVSSLVDPELIITNSKSIISPLELELFIKEHNVAIEFINLYWHDEMHKSSLYQQIKVDYCNKKNIKLIYVFEDEWRDKKEIIKSIIKHKLDKTSKIDVKDCSVKVLTSKERKDFFSNNHIDGDTNAQHAIGLIYNDEIVSAISVRNHFHKTQLEIARMCSKINVTIEDGLDRLINEVRFYAQQNSYDKLIVYVDTRNENGKSWNDIGWKMISNTPPKFWWTDHTNRFNRFKYKANKSKNLSEKQIAINEGVVKIWGCKNLIFELPV